MTDQQIIETKDLIGDFIDETCQRCGALLPATMRRKVNGMEAGREIKFRMWDFVNKEMIDGDSLAFEEYAPIKHLLSRKGIMQFTGLRDKNGKEIYEGDILRDRESYDEIYYYKVIWSESNCCFYFKNIFGDYDCFGGEDLYLNKIEVVGNIYENPELLQSA